MTTIKAFIHDGRIKLDEPLDLPEGSEVEVTVRPVSVSGAPLCMTEQQQGDSPEAIERWIAFLESVPPLTMSDEGWTAWMKRRREDREWELSSAEEREASLRESLE